MACDITVMSVFKQQTYGGEVSSHSHDRLLSLSLLWRHNGCGNVSNHQPRDCFLNRLFTRRSKKTSKLRVTGLCAGNSPGTGEFPTQMASNAENVPIWWRHYDHGNPYTGNMVCESNRWHFDVIIAESHLKHRSRLLSEASHGDQML